MYENEEYATFLSEQSIDVGIRLLVGLTYYLYKFD